MLRRKTFKTMDATGCQITVEATYYGKDYNFYTKQWESHAEYRARGLKANTLAELKKLLADK